MALAAFVLPLALPHAAVAAPAPATAETHALKWAELRTEASRLETDWQWQRTVLQATQDALQQKLQQLEAQRDLLRAKHGQTRADLDQQAAANAAGHEAIRQLDQRLLTLSERVLQLRPRLPPRLASAIELPAQSLADPGLPVAERVQHLITVESRCTHFNRILSYSEEVWPMPGEAQPRLLEILYWGLAGGYALDRDGQRAWLGQPAADRWNWQLQHGLAAPVEQLLAIHRDEVPPAFVSLPLQLDAPSPAAP